ncbi:MAG TPA: ADOP family duplicated permease [Vicinamibacterales bacterium]|nr:ADOP family duplicated permease [Vicinamibacterales bacterium]
MDTLRTDLRFAFRALIARPGFSALAVLTLAIGIGVNAIAFSALNGLLYKPTKFDGARHLGWITMSATGNPHGYVSWPDYQDIARSTRAFDAIAAEGRRPFSFHDGQTVRQVWGLCVSSNYLTALAARPAIGRVFSPADVSGTEVPVVVSYRFWNEQLGGGDTVAGRTMTLNARSVAIVGVMPDDFQGPGGLFEADVWLPLDRADVLGFVDVTASRERAWLALIGRLSTNITTAAAAADLQAAVASLPLPSRIDTRVNRTLRFWPLLEGHPEARGIAPFAYIALAIVGLVLLLACFNVAGLLLARAADRQRDISIRAALGASRGRIIRQFALEGLCLAIVSGAAAIVVATWSADLLSAFSLPSPIPQRLHLGVDGRVIAFISAMVVLAGVLPALVPAFHATRADLLRSMKLDAGLGRQRARGRKIFVIGQVAGSTLLLTVAFLVVRSFLANAAVDPGFDPARVLVLEIKPSEYGYDAARTQALIDQLVERLRARASVEYAAAADRVPFYVGFPRVARVAASGNDCAGPDCKPVFVYAVGDGHFQALGIPLRAGRELTPRDVQSGDAVIVSERLAARLWPHGNAIGETLRDVAGGRQLQVVGVAADVMHRSFNESPGEYLYRPLRRDDYAESLSVIVRTRAATAAFASDIQSEIRSLDPALPPGTIKTMAQRMEMPLWPVRTAAGLFGICGALALILAMVGLFGTTYLAVGQRTREFGIRAALGATRRRVLTQVLGEGLRLTIPGLLAGLLGAAIIARAAASYLARVDPAAPSTYAAVAVVQLTVALLACALPAHRATQTDPVIALRAE